MENIKFFYDRNTGKKYAKIDGRDDFFEIVDGSRLDLVEAAAENFTYRRGRTVYVNQKIDELFNDDIYNLKDTIDVPVGDKIITFVVEHIKKGFDQTVVYFVSKDIVGKSSIDDMNDFLDDFTEKMPKELVNRLEEIEHVASVDGKEVRFSRKVNLLSLANLVETDYHSGEDDIVFDGLKTEAERCKNDNNGETCWYWTCSPYISYSTHFMSVTGYGYPNGGTSASGAFGVVPCFSICIDYDLFN